MATEKLSNQGFVSNYIGSDNILYTNNFKIKDIDETVKKLNNALFDNIVDDVNVNMSEAISSDNSNISNIYTLNTSEPGKYNFKGNDITSITEASSSSDNYYKNFLAYTYNDNNLRFSPGAVNEKIRVMNKNTNEYEVCKISDILSSYKQNNINKNLLFSQYNINNKIFRNNLDIYNLRMTNYLTGYARKYIYIKYSNFEHDSSHSDSTYYYISCRINLDNYSEIPSVDNIIGIRSIAQHCNIDCDLCTVIGNIIIIYVKITKPYQSLINSDTEIVSIVYQNTYYGGFSYYKAEGNYQYYDFDDDSFTDMDNQINENTDKYGICKNSKIYLFEPSNSSTWKPGDNGYLHVFRNDIISKYKIYSLTFYSEKEKEYSTFIITYIYGSNNKLIRTLINWFPITAISQRMINLEIQLPGGLNYNGAYVKLNCFLDPYNVENTVNFFDNSIFDNIKSIEDIRNYINNYDTCGNTAIGLVAATTLEDEFIAYLNSIRSNQINIEFNDIDSCAYVYSAFAEEETPINMKTIIPYNSPKELISPGYFKTLLSFGPDNDTNAENYKCCAHISFNYIVPSVEFISDSTKFNNLISNSGGYTVNHKLEISEPSNTNKNYWEKIGDNKYKYNATYLVYHSEENGAELELSYLPNHIFLYRTYITANENTIINQDNPFTIQKDTLKVYISSTGDEVYLNISAEIIPNWDSVDPFSSQDIGYKFSINSPSVPGSLRPMLYSIDNNTILFSTSIDSYNRDVSSYFPSGTEYYNNVSVKCNSYITNILSEFKNNPTNVETDIFVSRLGFKDSHITQKNIDKINVLDDRYSVYQQNETSDTNSTVSYYLPKMANLYTLKNQKFGLGTSSESETPENGFVRIIL